MNNRIGLSTDQLYELTGYRRPHKIIEALAIMDVAFKVKPDGTPFVSLNAINPVAMQDDENPKAVLTLI